MRLYDITKQYRDIVEEIVNNYGEIDEEQVKALEENAEDFNLKAEAYACKIKELQVESDALKEQIDGFAERKKQKDNQIEYLKGRLSEAMQLYGKNKVETLNAVISYRTSTAVEVIDEEAIPSEYKTVKTDIKVDKVKLKEILKSGVEVSGAALKENRNIQIK